MPTSRLPHLAALLLPLAALAGCQRAAAPAPPPPPAVTVSRPIVRDAVVWDEYTGRLEAVDTVDVHARVSGYIQTAPFQEGALVKQGDVLFTLDARPFQAQLDNALGEVTQAQARLQLARNELTRAQQAPPPSVPRNSTPAGRTSTRCRARWPPPRPPPTPPGSTSTGAA